MAKASIGHVIAIAGPILGTPIANSVTQQLGTGRYALLTVASALPFQQMVFPPVTPNGLLDVLNDQFAKDLATDASGSGELASIRSAWLSDPILSQLPVITVGGTFPDPQIAGEYIPLGPCITGCFGDFPQEPFDGIVGLDSAFGQGLDYQLYRIPALPLFHTDMVDNAGVLESLELQLKQKTSLLPKLTISTSSVLASCQDSHWCSGPPGSEFTFTGSGFTQNSSQLSIYVQDVTGTQDVPISATALPDGTHTWRDPTPSSKAPGNYGIWVYDPDSGASNSVIETICSATCPSLTSTVSVASSPQIAQLVVGSQQQFTSTVTGTQNTAVTWSVNGVVGGDSAVGTITPAGLYTAPAAVPSQSTITVTATSQAAPTAIATSVVTIVPASISPPGNGQWTWMSGSSTAGADGVYGSLGGPSTSNIPGAREGAVTWTDAQGNLWLFGGDSTDFNGSFGDFNDLWKFNPSTATWTWVSGANTRGQGGVYGIQGSPATANVPGARDGAVSWIDSNGNLWLFSGFFTDSNGNGQLLNDLWKFNPTANEWTWVSGANSLGQAGTYGTQGSPASPNVPGARHEAASWIDDGGNLWLFGGQGFDSTGSGGELNDLWEFSPITQEWTWVAGGNTANQPGVLGTKGVPATTNAPGARFGSTSWVDASGNFWLFGGSGVGSGGALGQFNDLWKFNPAANAWTWVSGSNTLNQTGIYGTQGTPASTNVPGARREAAGWTDGNGNLWLFGGVVFDSTGTAGYLNDLWEFSPVPNTWTWVSGSNASNQSGIYGTQGTPAQVNVPGGRSHAGSWIDFSGDIWLFGGLGIDSTGGGAWWLNDLWRFRSSMITPPTINPTPAINGLMPSFLQVGSSPQKLQINGAGFLPSSVVTFNGVSHAPTYSNSGLLSIELAAPDLSTIGNFPVVVTNPTPGGGMATSVFTVSSTANGMIISPSAVTVPAGATQTFIASAPGGGTVTWGVQEGAAGGSVSSAGIYTAPGTTGTFHVAATQCLLRADRNSHGHGCWRINIHFI